jgi:ABC-type antimicrobial peptide transport system permease subunit
MVTALLADVPQNSHLQFDYVIPFLFLRGLGYSVDRWDNSTFYTYVKIPEEISREKAAEKIADFLKPKPTLEEFATLDLQPIPDIHFRTDLDFDMAWVSDKKMVTIFCIIGVFIILIACINFMNLATARSARRAREIGLKKVAGAVRRNIIQQFFIESTELAFLSILIAMALVELVRPSFNSFTGVEMKIPYSEPWLYIALVIIVLFTGLLSGSYPSLYLSSLKPVLILKGASKHGKGHAIFRTSLVIFQFTLSVILISGTLILYQQINFMRKKNLGYDKENLVWFFFGRSDQVSERYETFRQELLKNPSILAVTRTANLPTYGYTFSNSLWHWEGQDPGRETLIRNLPVGYDYFSTMGIEVLKGRTFSRDFLSDSLAVVVNEAAAKAMNMEDPVGKFLKYFDHEERYTIIGLIKDYHYRSLHNIIEP